MSRYMLLLAAAAVLPAVAAPAHADCVEVRGNGTIIYSGPAGTIYGVDVDTNPADCLHTVREVLDDIPQPI